ncbi:hypothetical protein LS684_20720 (plasmid) [Cytobacillus spongiae]|uniref:hypothetical protein n=1 Tax=Cytobacillus spongiae TaxID=2901381 RepID=UPI001F423D11|nr:hypothetical protein [Cytobacillus spongiae]UII58055.1 hypothetical protein LS684_20720 [Cytobacillus spongiae]
MIKEENEAINITVYPKFMNDIQMLSEELESLYSHYSRRMKSVSEELSRERAKHKVYQLEVAENHQTIQLLTEQIDYLLVESESKYERNGGQFSIESESTDEESSSLELVSLTAGKELREVDELLLPPVIPEIRVLYENTYSYKKTMMDRVKNEVISMLIEANEYFISDNKRPLEFEINSIAYKSQLAWIRKQQRQYMKRKKERWYSKMWNFLWGKQDSNHPEVIKKLNLIEEQLESYSDHFNEVKESLTKNNERDEATQNYLQRMSALHEELKKIEMHYEDELQALRNQIEEFRQRETDLEKQLKLMTEKNTEKQEEKNQREAALEKELTLLRQNQKSQSIKKNDLYSKMKRQREKADQGNPQFEEFGNLPMAPEGKRTMFDPNKYIR